MPDGQLPNDSAFRHVVGGLLGFWRSEEFNLFEHIPDPLDLLLLLGLNCALEQSCRLGATVLHENAVVGYCFGDSLGSIDEVGKQTLPL